MRSFHVCNPPEEGLRDSMNHILSSKDCEKPRRGTIRRQAQNDLVTLICDETHTSGPKLEIYPFFGFRRVPQVSRFSRPGAFVSSADCLLVASPRRLKNRETCQVTP